MKQVKFVIGDTTVGANYDSLMLGIPGNLERLTDAYAKVLGKPEISGKLVDVIRNAPDFAQVTATWDEDAEEFSVA